MGDAFYSVLVHWFVNDANRHLGESAVVLSSLCDLAVAIACFVITGVLVWFTRKSILIRSTRFIYMAMMVLTLSGLERLTHIFYAPSIVEMTLDGLSTVTAIAAAAMMFQQRHTVIAMVYQFKYVVGLLRSIDKLES